MNTALSLWNPNVGSVLWIDVLRKEVKRLRPQPRCYDICGRIDDITNGKLRWGILTNGSKWRLYYSGARSVSEQFFELDLAKILNLQGFNDDFFALDAQERTHWLKVFLLIFRSEAFTPTGADPRSFHEKIINESRFYEERDDIRYIYSTFPIVEREETEKYGIYRSRELCLAYMNALAVGNPDADISL